jgi:hypothetical protein
MKRAIAFSLFLTIVCLGYSVAIWASEKTDDSFPMSEGTYWIYRGVVRWTHENSDETSETKVAWKTEIRRLVRHGEYSAAVVRGFPSDLNWSNGKPQPADSLLIRFRGDKFYLVSSERVEADLKRLQNSQDSLDGILDEDDLFLQLPLAKGKKFCDPENMAREDGGYCWTVESAAAVPLNLKGVPSGSRTSYTLRYATNPDDIEFDFVPGVGIVSYSYHHHGTVADTELELSEFHPAAVQPE